MASSGSAAAVMRSGPPPRPRLSPGPNTSRAARLLSPTSAAKSFFGGHNLSLLPSPSSHHPSLSPRRPPTTVRPATSHPRALLLPRRRPADLALPAHPRRGGAGGRRWGAEEQQQQGRGEEAARRPAPPLILRRGVGAAPPSLSRADRPATRHPPPDSIRAEGRELCLRRRSNGGDQSGSSRGEQRRRCSSCGRRSSRRRRKSRCTTRPFSLGVGPTVSGCGLVEGEGMVGGEGMLGVGGADVTFLIVVEIACRLGVMTMR
ncbi:unnamed protein product [Urochloa humidicola]